MKKLPTGSNPHPPAQCPPGPAPVLPPEPPYMSWSPWWRFCARQYRFCCESTHHWSPQSWPGHHLLRFVPARTHRFLRSLLSSSYHPNPYRFLCNFCLTFKYFEHQSNTTGYACICQEKFPGFGLGFPDFHRQNSPLCKKVGCKRFQMLIFFELFINFTFYYHILPFWGGRDIDFFWRIC